MVTDTRSRDLSADLWQFATIDNHAGAGKLRYATLKRPQEPKRFVVFVNGRTEWIEKYPDLPSWLNLQDDCGFLTWDHWGQGASGGLRSWIDSYESYALDAKRIINHVIGDREFMIVAHSMGSLISLYSTMRGYINPKQLALSSPLLKLPERPLPHFIARPVSWVLAWTRFSQVGTGAGKHEQAKFDDNKLTHDEATFRRIQATPYPCRSASFGWVNETYKALRFVHSVAALSKFTVRTLITTGDDERVVDPQGIDKWCARAKLYSKAQIGTLSVPRGRHELFSETAEFRDPVIARIRGIGPEFVKP